MAFVAASTLSHHHSLIHFSGKPVRLGTGLLVPVKTCCGVTGRYAEDGHDRRPAETSLDVLDMLAMVIVARKVKANLQRAQACADRYGLKRRPPINKPAGDRESAGGRAGWRVSSWSK